MAKQKTEHTLALTIIALSTLVLLLWFGWWLGQRNTETGCNDSRGNDLMLNNLCAEPTAH